MVYGKGALFFEMLKYVVGEDAFRRGLRAYYAEWHLKHVSEDAFRRAMETAAHQDLGWFFAEWLHGTPLVDYALRRVQRTRTADGWLTRITIARLGDGVMPVDIAVPAGDTTLIVRAEGMALREVVEVRTQTRTGRVELDPARRTMDWNYLNNLEGPPLPFGRTLATGREAHHFGWSATTPALRDRRVINWMPLAWYNDIGGATLGFQSRANYFGRFELNQIQLTWPTGLGNDSAGGQPWRWRPDWYVSLRNPVRGRAAGLTTESVSWWLEGRVGGRVAAERERKPHFDSPLTLRRGASLTVMAVTDARYLDRRRWDDVNTAELTAWATRTRAREPGASSSRVEVTAGQSFWTQLRDVNTVDPVVSPRDVRGATYARGLLDHRREVPVGRLDLRLRFVAAGTLGGTSVPLQRRIFLGGADPYATFTDPFLRSRGGLLAADGAHYQAAGGLGLRGFAPFVSATWGVALNAEAALKLVTRPQKRVFSDVRVAAFADAALLDPQALGRAAAGDAGVGLRATHRIGPTRFVTRVDFPLLVTRPAAAVAGAAGDGAFKLRWVWSLEEAF
jgi:hypothetical protein